MSIDQKNKLLLSEIIRCVVAESKASDAFEQRVADVIDEVGGEFISASQAGPVTLPDVLVDVTGLGSTYVEVKMSHRDNLANPRIYYDGSSWQSRAKSPVAREAVKMANETKSASEFILDLKEFMGLSPNDIVKIPTTKGGLKDEKAVPLQTMKDFVNQRGSRYFVNEENVDIADLVTQHYLVGKSSPANYIQAGDDFYLIGEEDPLQLQFALDYCGYDNIKIPVFKGTGNFKVRISTRSEFYEVQPELKISKMVPEVSPVSALSKGGSKVNPFQCLRKYLEENNATLADLAYSQESSEPYESQLSQAYSDREAAREDGVMGAGYKRVIQSIISEMLLLEELTATDKKEIERIARKQSKKEITKAIGNDLSKTIQKEVEKIFKNKATKEEIAAVCQSVMKKLYKALSTSHSNVIDGIKV